MNNELIYRSANDNEVDLKLYKNCFDNNESVKKIEKIKWLLFKKKNIWINFASVLSNDLEKVVGVIATLPLRTKYFNESILSGQYLDTMTDKDFRGKGLFVTLAKQSYENIAKNGCMFGWGFPNINAAHGWFNKLGWKEFDSVPFIIKPISTRFIKNKVGGFASKLLPVLPLAFVKKNRINSNTELITITEFDNRFDTLWNAFSKSINIGVIRDAAYLNWRYVQKPFENYYSLAIIDKQSKAIKAYITYCIKNKHGGRIGYVMELMHAQNCEVEAKQILTQATNEIIKQKADLILSWCLNHSPNFSVYKKCNFWKLPKKLQFIKMYFGGISFDDNKTTEIMNKQNWYLSYSDSDTV